MSISKKFFSALAVLAMASSVVPSTTANAQATGTVRGTASNLVFCNGPATPAAPSASLGATAPNLPTGGTYYVARDSRTGTDAIPAGRNANGQCINTVAIAGIPTYSGHQTSFTVRLDGNAIGVTNVVVMNNAPIVAMNTMCIVKDTRANFAVTDTEGDQVTASAVISPINGDATGTGSTIQYTPNSGFVGTDTFSFDIQDRVMLDGEDLTVSITPGTTGLAAGVSDTTYSVNPSGVRLSRVNLTANVVDNANECPNMSSSSMMSSMNSSMMSSSMSSSMMSSSMSSSMMSSSMMSSSMRSTTVVYVEVPTVVSGKGMTIRTGQSN